MGGYCGREEIQQESPYENSILYAPMVSPQLTWVSGDGIIHRGTAPIADRDMKLLEKIASGLRENNDFNTSTV